MPATRSPSKGLDGRLADATVRAYASDWVAFTSWCLLEHVASLPALPATVVRYLRVVAKASRVSSLRRKMVAIRQMHRSAGFELDLTASSLKAIVGDPRPELAVRSRAKLSEASLRRMLGRVPASISGMRDRAMILMLWALRCRPAELVALKIADVQLSRGRARVTIRARPEPIELRIVSESLLCAVSGLRGWLDMLQREPALCEGSAPLFRGVTRFGSLLSGRLSVQTVRLVLLRAAMRAGVPAEELSADGLRNSKPAEVPRARSTRRRARVG